MVVLSIEREEQNFKMLSNVAIFIVKVSSRISKTNKLKFHSGPNIKPQKPMLVDFYTCTYIVHIYNKTY